MSVLVCVLWAVLLMLHHSPMLALLGMGVVLSVHVVERASRVR